MISVTSLNDSLFKAFRDAGESQGWLNAPGLLLAVSGGSDSMALLNLARRCYGGRIAVAHLEHGFRGRTSLQDAAFVEEYCRKIGIPCYVRHADVPNHMEKGESSEMAGRRARYDFFFELLERENLTFVATGHTADDAVETMLYHLFRGTGMKGLAGIAPVNGRVARPLIKCRRERLRKFLTDTGTPWREDETNDENCYLRNKIRNQLLPWVRENLNASPERVLLGLAGQAAAAEAQSEAEARLALPWLLRAHPMALAAWDTATARRFGEARLTSLLRLQGAELGLPPLHRGRMKELRSLIGTRGRWRFQWSGEIEVCGSRSLIGWIERAALKPPEDITVDLSELRDGGRKNVRWGRWRVEFVRETNLRRPFGGIWQTRISAGPSDIVHIASASSAVSGRKKTDRIPWWSLSGWPVIGNWVPGVEKSVREESACAMIAKVFCEEIDGEKQSQTRRRVVYGQ